MNYLNPTTLEELFSQDTLDYIKKHLLRFAPYVELQPNPEHQSLSIIYCRVPIEQWEYPSILYAPGAVRVTIREIEGQLKLAARVMRCHPRKIYKDPRLNSRKVDGLKTILNIVSAWIVFGDPEPS